METNKSVENFNWEQEGYQPLVYSNGWQVALLNWEPIFLPDRLAEIERHCQTDEVFVLISGKATLISINPAGVIEIVEMKPNLIYNVLKGTWHHLIATRDATWVIVENRDTHLTDTEYRHLLKNEISEILIQLPNWVWQIKE